MGSGNPRYFWLLRADADPRAGPRRINAVFQMISEEYREKGLTLPADTTEIVHA